MFESLKSKVCESSLKVWRLQLKVCESNSKVISRNLANLVWKSEGLPIEFESLKSEVQSGDANWVWKSKVDPNRVWKCEVDLNRVWRAEFGIEVVALGGHRNLVGYLHQLLGHASETADNWLHVVVVQTYYKGRTRKPQTMSITTTQVDVHICTLNYSPMVNS